MMAVKMANIQIDQHLDLCTYMLSIADLSSFSVQADTAGLVASGFGGMHIVLDSIGCEIKLRSW